MFWINFILDIVKSALDYFKLHKKSYWGLGILGILYIIGLIGFMSYRHSEEIWSHWSEGKDLKQSITSNTHINAELNQLLASLNADRVSLYQYHNSLEGINGMPFFFMSMTHQAIRQNIGSNIHSEQKIPLSTLGKDGLKLLDNQCLQVNNKNYICPLFKEKQLLGHFQIEYIFSESHINQAKISNLKQFLEDNL